MSDQDKKPVKKGGYKGKNPNPNHDPKTYFAEKAANKGKTPQRQNQGKPRAVGATIDKPTHTEAMNNPTPTKTEPLYKDAIFAPEIYIRENNMRAEFHPSAARVCDIADQIWNEMCVENAQIDKQMLVEGVRYYTAALFWIRAVSIKRANSITLTDNEVRLLSIFEGTQLNIPEPLFLYLRGFGTIEDTGTGQNLIAKFPDLPETPNENGFGGYWGTIAAENINNYQDYPALGVLAEGIRQALSDAGTGNYVSSIAIDGMTVNQNLVGYRPLVNRRNEAKNFFLNKAVTQNAFPESIPGTAVNYGLIQAISVWIGTSTTFKNNTVDATKMERTGSNSQLVSIVPEQREVLATQRTTTGPAHARSLERCSANIYGVAIYGVYQPYREARTNNNDNLSLRSRVWCCVDYTGANAGTTIPAAVVNARNTYRDLPPEFSANRFSTVSTNLGDTLIRVVNRMVIAKR